ncbi:MAG: HAMP domain-containing histidine kinase [Acidobacteria bacterium]|nr:HAMP domain-containing histidine kinase [Acidobacteriota bacterium]
MSERRWFRSLYWRIGLGFIALVAVLLLMQAASFVWIAAETEGGQPMRAAQDAADLIAADLETALASDPALDLAAEARQRIDAASRPAFVVLLNRVVVGPEGVEPPPGLQRLMDVMMARGGRDIREPGGPLRERFPRLNQRLRQRMLEQGRPPDLEGPLPDPFGPDGGVGPPGLSGPGPGGGPLGALRRRTAVTPVLAPTGRRVAFVVVGPNVAYRQTAGALWPWLALGGAVLLLGGTAVAALLVFRPAQAQLRALEAAAGRLGDGDLRARAPEEGTDEVASVARAFNRMAGDLETRQQQLTDIDRARRQLLADVSHELMTPLTAIRGYAETLGLPGFGPATAEGQRAVQVIQDEGARIERLVGDLLDLSRYEAGGVSLHLDEVEVAVLLSRVVARHEQQARDQGIALRVDLPDPQITVEADPHRLEQALQNLASNALRYTRRGGHITLHAVSGTTDQARPCIRFSVTDDGVGIAPEHVPHVFERFYKADPSRAMTGSGLGLSIVKAIAERHGGCVSVRSTPSVDTTFELEVPQMAELR